MSSPWMTFMSLDCILLCLPRGVKTWWLGIFSVIALYPPGKKVIGQRPQGGQSPGGAAQVSSNVLRQQERAQAACGASA